MSDVFRDGKVYVMAEQCSTCIFRPGNLMRLRRGRVAQMVRDATRNESCIPCHQTIHGQAEHEAVCRGFSDKHKTSTLQIAERMNLIAFDGEQSHG